MSFGMTIFMLAVVFQLKHLLADYFWQNHYMLGKFKVTKWEVPLGVHCAVHGVITAIIVASVTFSWKLTLALVVLDMVTHFIIDRTKVISSRGLTTEDPKFWHNLGMDQFLHHITHYVIILVIVKSIFP